MRVYLHYLGQPEHAKVFRRLPKDATIDYLIEEFVKDYAARFPGAAACRAHVHAQHEGKCLAGSLKAADVLPDRADVYVVADADGTAADQPQVYAGSEPAASAAATATPVVHPVAAPAPAQQAVQVPLPTVPQLEDLLAQAEVMQSRGQLLGALQLCQQVLQRQPTHAAAAQRAASLLLNAGRSEEALQALQPCADAWTGGWQLQTLLGDCLMAVQRWDQALEAFKQGLEACVQVGSRQEQLSLQVRCARALHAQGGVYGDAGAHLVMAVLQQDPENSDALRQYAKVAAERGLWSDCMKVALRLVMGFPDDEEVHQLLAACFKTQEGWQTLTSELAGNPEAHAALAFLATSVKEQGAVEEAIRLFRLALQDWPSGSSTYELNLAHAIELQQDLQGVVTLVAECVKHALQQGSCEAVGNMPVDLQAVLSLLENLPTLPCATERTWLAAKGSRDAASNHQEPVQSRGPAPSSTLQYTQEQLDFLALLFTAVKVLYVGGALSTAWQLCQLLEEARAASAEQLHRTSIRNEAAYAGCIQQLLKQHWPAPLPEVVGLQDQPLFLVGDSHTLSGAWRVVVLQGQLRLLHPLLVTGLKIWHLREGSSFYPKMQWERTLELLPAGAQVVLVLGEIDCREGLALAVAHLKYTSLDQAINALLDLWVQLLLDIIVKRHLELFIHPVPPVLNETRHVVRPFVAACRRRITAAAALPQAAGRLHWLELFDQLLDGGGMALAPGLELDGTHLSPAYLKHLQMALDQVP